MTTFNMAAIGQTIANLRKEHNMTQLQLADEMGVSYQAISNWERGQSMPDIAKLPDLAAFFGVTIDQLLGKHAPLVEEAISGDLPRYAAEHPISQEELEEVAPMLLPDQVDALAGTLSASDLYGLLPFMSSSKIDALLLRAVQHGDDTVFMFAPLASSRALGQAADLMVQSGLDITRLLPFLSSPYAHQHMMRAIEEDRDFSRFAPFVSSDSLRQAVQVLEAKGRSFNCLYPFLPKDTIDSLILARMKKRQPVKDLFPFASKHFADSLADKLL